MKVEVKEGRISPHKDIVQSKYGLQKFEQ